MKLQRIGGILAMVLLVTSLLPAATAQTVGPVDLTNALGISENDVGDEPQFPTEESNGFPSTGFSPTSPTLVLESHTEVSGEVVEEDVNNVVNRAVHGSSYSDYESYIYPGFTSFGAYWGWWEDKGSGGSLQEDQVTEDDTYLGQDVVNTAQPNDDANGAIDDDSDYQDSAWDEFIWRGDNSAAPDHGFCDSDGDGSVDAECANEEMYVFLQPGTQNIHINCVFVNEGIVYAAVDGCVLDNASDNGQAPDFSMAYGNQSWEAENGFARANYDQSLLMSTKVTTSVDPQDAGSTDQGVNLYDPTSGDAWDVDRYSAVDTRVEELYRMTVWDPGNQESSPTDTVHNEGVKEYVKDEVSTSAVPSLDAITEPTESIAGTVKTQLSPIQKHEPTRQADDYNGHATFDADTCYGECPDGADADHTADYYEPGANQAYDGYQSEEHLFADGMTWWDGCPIYAGVMCYGGNYYAPGGSAGSSTGSDNAAPYALYVKSNIGSWFDANGDTWVGDASQGKTHLGFPGDVHLTLPAGYEAEAGDPYASGMIEDPNNYGSDEFRGACVNSGAKAVLTPLTEGQKWGTTGVYVMPQSGNPYTPAVEDASGGAGADTTKPVRDQHWALDYFVPGEDTDETAGKKGQLTRYVTEGAIEITGWCSAVTTGSGDWEPTELIVFPAGNVDYEIRMEFTVNLVNDHYATQGTNSGNNLKGESITDVDIIEPMVQQPAAP